MKRWLQQLLAEPRIEAAARRFAREVTFVRARFAQDSAVGLRLTLSVALFIAATWLFAGVAEDIVTGDPLVEVDRQITRWFHAHATPGLTRWMIVISDAHDVTVISVFGLAFAAYLTWRRQWHWLIALVIALPGGMLCNLLLKQIFRRARPSLDEPLLTLATYSFPSGHVTGATLFYGLLAAFLASRLPTWQPRLQLGAGAALLVTLVAITRIYLGVHHFSDVVAAAAWSTAWLVMVLVAVDAFRHRRAHLL